MHSYYLNKQIIKLFLIAVPLSCNNRLNECPDLVYDGLITTLNNSKFTGTCNTYDQKNNIISTQTYLEGLDHGEWIFYFTDGQIKTQGKLELGKKIGEWKYFHENGNLKQIAYYDESGLKTGKWSFFNEEEILLQEQFFDFIGDLTSISFYRKDGSIRKIETYKQNGEIDIIREFDKNGNLIQS